MTKRDKAAVKGERELGREAQRLLAALTSDGAAPARADLREGFLAVAGRRRGVTAILANSPIAAGAELVAADLAVWTSSGRLAPTEEGRAFARRRAAPAGVEPFLAQHTPLAFKPARDGGAAMLVDEAESPLAWLARRKGRDGAALIDSAQFEAGERFRRDIAIGQLLPRVTADWSGVGGGGRRGPDTMTIGEAALAARQRIDRARDAVGADLAGLVIDICGFQKGLELVERERRWPPRSAKIVLRIALDRLAAHYGLASVARGRDRAPLRAWTAANDQPAIVDGA